MGGAINMGVDNRPIKYSSGYHSVFTVQLVIHKAGQNIIHVHSKVEFVVYKHNGATKKINKRKKKGKEKKGIGITNWMAALDTSPI
jgi:hypothetical protein